MPAAQEHSLEILNWPGLHEILLLLMPQFSHQLILDGRVIHVVVFSSWPLICIFKPMTCRYEYDEAGQTSKLCTLEFMSRIWEALCGALPCRCPYAHGHRRQKHQAQSAWGRGPTGQGPRQTLTAFKPPQTCLICPSCTFPISDRSFPISSGVIVLLPLETRLTKKVVFRSSAKTVTHHTAWQLRPHCHMLSLHGADGYK